jgi:hypothetical protein
MPTTTRFLDDAVVRDGLAEHLQECYGRADRYVNARASLQLRILRLGFFQDGDVGVGVFEVCILVSPSFGL